MAMDSRDKRGSALGVNLASPRVEQHPQSTIAQAGRQIAALVYSGILAAAPFVPTPATSTGTTWNAETTSFSSYNDETTAVNTWNAEVTAFLSYNAE